MRFRSHAALADNIPNWAIRASSTSPWCKEFQVDHSNLRWASPCARTSFVTLPIMNLPVPCLINGQIPPLRRRLDAIG